MRKMNKIVALSLVLAMALSMMASAVEFKDQTTINANLVDEINLLVALGVYSENGTGAGYFEPNMTITRAQAAKILYVLKNKGVDNGATSWTGLNIFADVEAGAWYEGYANYCASTGIMIGTGEGNFTPDGKLTGTELAKMLLVLIGYKSDIEGYAGNGWDNNILADAEEAGILEAYELPVKGIVTREWAAKMIVNALYANKVKYSNGVAEEQYSNYVENNKIVARPVTYAGQDLGLIEQTAIAMGTTKYTLNTVDGAPALKKDGTTSVVTISGVAHEIAYEITADKLAQQVNILYKDTDNVAGLTKGDKIYGVTTTGESKVYNVNFADITVDTTANTIKFAGYNNGDAKAYGAMKVMTYNNMHANQAPIVAMLNNLKNTPYAGTLVDTNNDGYIDVMFGAVPVIGKVTQLNAAKNLLTIKDGATTVLFSASTEKAFAKVNFVDEIVKNDIVAGIYDYSTGEAILNLTKVDTVVGKIEKLNKNASGTTTSYLINGETYKTAFNYIANAESSKPAGLTTKDATFYVVDNFVVFSEAITNKADQENIVLYLTKNSADGVFASKKVQVMGADGVKSIYDYKVIEKVADQPTGYVTYDSLATSNGEFICELVKDGEQVYFKNLVTTNDGTDATGETIVYSGNVNISFDADKDVFTLENRHLAEVEGTFTNEANFETTGLAQKQLPAEDSFFFVKNSSGTWKVLKGSEIVADIANTAVAPQLATSKSGVPAVKYGVIVLAGTTFPTDSVSSEVYGILASTNTKLYIDNVEHYEVNITLMDGTVKTLTTKVNPQADLKKFVKFTEDSKGIATISAAGFTAGNFTGVSGKTVYINGSLLELADDVKVYSVDQTFKADGTTPNTFVVVEGAELVVAAEGVTGNNVLYKTNTAGKISVVVVEFEGEAIATSTFVK